MPWSVCGRRRIFTLSLFDILDRTYSLGLHRGLKSVVYLIDQVLVLK